MNDILTAVARRVLTLLLLLWPVALLAEADSPVMQVEPTKAAHQIGDLPLNIQGAATLLGIVAVIFTLITGNRKVRRENEADARASEERIKEAHKADAERIDRSQRERSDEIRDQLIDLKTSLGERMKAVETAIVDFMPRAEIEGKMDHEKNNRVHADEASARVIQRHDERLGRLEVDVGRMAERQGGIVGEVTEMKGLLKDVSREMAAGFDKMRDQIRHAGVGA